LTFEEDDEFLLEVIGKKYAFLHHPTAICHSLSTYAVRSTFLETTSVGCTLLWELHQVQIMDFYADQAADQVPYNDDSESEGEYALDEVSSDVEMNPEDMVNLPSDEDEEDTGWGPHHLLFCHEPY
jgi:hypothetical protein